MSIILLIAYFIPTIMALVRSHNSKLAIIVVNILFGWTVIGWIWAFIWSLTGNKQPQIIVINEAK
ncbi:immunity to superinfection protein [Citrobacter phage CkP1]|nr:immunity to superinfection protein [Citrobacter phage CkP1]